MRLIVTTVDQNFRGGGEKWDIIGVTPDSYSGRMETMNQWIADGGKRNQFPAESAHLAVINIPGEPPDMNLAEPEHEATPNLDDAEDRKWVAKASWQIREADLSAAERTELEGPGGEITIDRTRRTMVRRKEDGLILPDTGGDDGETPIRRLNTHKRTVNTVRPDPRPERPRGDQDGGAIGRGRR